MITDKLEKMMYDSVGKNVQVFCKDGSTLEGLCTEYCAAYDNDPEEASITLDRPMKDGKRLPWLTEVLKGEIEKVTVF